MAQGWPHPPAEPEAARVFPQPVFALRAFALAGLATGLGAAAVGLVRHSAWLAPFSLALAMSAALAAWAAAVQWVGSEKVDDHPWV